MQQEGVLSLGMQVRDKLTGFKGTTVSKHEYLYGTTQFGVQAQIGTSGELPEPKFFNAGYLVEDTSAKQ